MGTPLYVSYAGTPTSPDAGRRNAAVLASNILFEAALSEASLPSLEYSAHPGLYSRSFLDENRDRRGMDRIVAVTLYDSAITSVNSFADFFKEDEGVTFCIGGPGVRNYPREVLEQFRRSAPNGRLIATKGTHEEFRHIISILAGDGGEEEIVSVPGTRMLSHGEVHEGPESDVIPCLTKEAYSKTISAISREMLSHYISPEDVLACISLTLGCDQGRCSMCMGWSFNPYRAPTPEEYERLIELLPSHIDHVQLSGNITARDGAALADLFGRIGKKGRQYYIVARLDHFLSKKKDRDGHRKPDRKLIERLRKSGVVHVEAGLENFDVFMNLRIKPGYFDSLEARKLLSEMVKYVDVSLDCMSFDNVASIGEFCLGMFSLGAVQGVTRNLQHRVTPYKGTAEYDKLIAFCDTMEKKGYTIRQFKETADGFRPFEGLPIHPNPYLFIVSLLHQVADYDQEPVYSEDTSYQHALQCAVAASKIYGGLLSRVSGERIERELKELSILTDFYLGRIQAALKIEDLPRKEKVGIARQDVAGWYSAYELGEDEATLDGYTRVILDELKRRGLPLGDDPSVLVHWLEAFDEVREKFFKD